MSITISHRHYPSGLRLPSGSLILGAAATASSSSGAAAVTISAKSVPGFGTVLVNGQGQTLYMLTSEKGGKITCTSSNGCTKTWPEIALPSGMTAVKAGSGVQSSMLGTVKDASGNLQITYDGWPLCTFSGPVARRGVRRGGPACRRRGAHSRRQALTRSPRNVSPEVRLVP